jgi:hypothetical protein
MFLIQYLKLKVSIGRIVEFLSEPEVDDQVSSFGNGSDDVRKGEPEGTCVSLVDTDADMIGSAGMNRGKTESRLEVERIGYRMGTSYGVNQLLNLSLHPHRKARNFRRNRGTVPGSGSSIRQLDLHLRQIL